jgi:phosphate transport system ATP-binding protein
MIDPALGQPADHQPEGQPSGAFASGLFGTGMGVPRARDGGMQPEPAYSDTALLPPARSEPLIGLEASNVSAWFSGHKVLELVSLRMEPGRVTALIGPSGCGKSTFLRILNRMHEMIKGAELGGQVLLAGQDIYDAAVRPADIRRRIGMVFQKPNPFPAMSIYDNVASGLKLSGMKVPNTADLVEHSLRRAGLWNEVHRRLKSPGGALSGGQQQ